MNRASRMSFSVRWMAFIVGALLISGCASLRPGYERPTVTVSSFRALPGSGAIPQFEIELQVINPNAQALELRGVSYTVSLEGHQLIKGVSNDLPVVEGYGQNTFTLTGSANLLAGIRLITDLMSSSRDSFRYELKAKLDPGPLVPSIRLTDAGEVAL
ncbi:MAG: LEA type 2 family protein [Lysobacterales bacterium]